MFKLINSQDSKVFSSSKFIKNADFFKDEIAFFDAFDLLCEKNIDDIQNKRKYSVKELSERLEVSPRMIRKYKDELECAGIYVDTIYGPYGGYVLNQDIKIPENFIKPRNIKLNNKEDYNRLSKCIKNHNKCYIEYFAILCLNSVKQLSLCSEDSCRVKALINRSKAELFTSE